jgi:DNA-directed DNA polymerase III PolC
MGIPFVPLRVHSVYSKGKGSVLLSELAGWSRRRKLPAAALSDRENLYGWSRWRSTAEEYGLHPAFGCEVDTADGRFVFLVKEQRGYWNLMQILNEKKVGNTHGLVVIYLPGNSRSGDKKKAEELRAEDFYVGADFRNFSLAGDVAGAAGCSLVWANPLKFIDNPERMILLHAIHTKKPFPPEKKRLQQYMRLFGPSQAEAAWKKFGARVEKMFHTTFEIAEKCRFAFDGIVPPLPETLFSSTLRDMVTEKLHRTAGLSWEERQRAQKELRIVEASGFAPYFLVVHDVVRFARSRGILHNLKGSGASSFLAYLLGVSHINPVKFDLYFERFLNPGRKDPPDFDLDFDSRHRDEVLEYVLKKYGQGQTGAAFVCSLKNYRARSAVYETARAFGLPPAEARGLSKALPFFAGPEYLKKGPPAPEHRDIWHAASGLAGVYSENSLHVGGVILTPAPVSRYLPLATSAKGLQMSHYDRDAVEDLKLIKLDLLSVRGLAAISGTRENISVDQIPLTDKAAFSRLQQAGTIGCFQVESPAMMNLLRRMKPADIQDLTAALALIRPGPTESGMKQALLRERCGKNRSRDVVLNEILPETKGLLLYEEQVMQVAERVAGMKPEDGDRLRRSFKKKSGRAPLRSRFFQEAGKRGYSRGDVCRLWAVMEKFSSYSFNKAHSASYAWMAYQAVYLKTHYPLPYLVAVLNAGGGYYPLFEYVEEARRAGLRILGPDVCRSGYQFTVEGNAVRVGLLSIKGLAVKSAEKIIEERKSGAYRTLEDFLTRVSLTKSELFGLIRAGAFDALEPRRIEQVLRYFQGLEGIETVTDLTADEKKRMVVESLGFDPDGDSLSLLKFPRPELRIKDLADRRNGDVELMVRVVDARKKRTRGGYKYFFLFEDETGLLEGVGEKPCRTFGKPPACLLRGRVCPGETGRPRITECRFPKMLP